MSSYWRNIEALEFEELEVEVCSVQCRQGDMEEEPTLPGATVSSSV